MERPVSKTRARNAIKYSVMMLLIGIVIVLYSGVEYAIPYAAADALVDVAQRNPERTAMAAAFSESLGHLGDRRSAILFILGGAVCLVAILQIRTDRE